ncbi:MAG: hypothetical protein HIU88_04185 [Acidobacteria bacterium]|nr:hypothetical protein [Acidobacteriota bacterium]
MSSPSRDERKRRRDAADEVIEKLTPRIEPPPMSKPVMPVPYAFPIPFGEPPAEPVTLVEGEIPWELRDDE